MKMTLKDIAEKAGVSMMTVSNVINGKHNRVSAKTIEKVNQIIKEYNYVPNLSARSLTNKTSNIIGIVIAITKCEDEAAYLENPYIEDNLALSFQMQLAAAEYFPTLTRKIYLKGYRYNMHLCPKSMLIEVGAQTNSFEEAKNAMEPLAFVLHKVLSGA